MSKVPRYKLNYLFKRMKALAMEKRAKIRREFREKEDAFNDAHPLWEPTPEQLIKDFSYCGPVHALTIKSAHKRLLHDRHITQHADDYRTVRAIMFELLGGYKKNNKVRKIQIQHRNKLEAKYLERLCALDTYMQSVEDAYMLDSEANLESELAAFMARSF